MEAASSAGQRCNALPTFSPEQTEEASTLADSVTPAPMVVLDGVEILTVGGGVSLACTKQGIQVHKIASKFEAASSRSPPKYATGQAQV
eukprot:1160495-Pelagomonas_calceolata.AAC.11